jgi:p-aminobenzoyl-glutamate transporter AbgT
LSASPKPTDIGELVADVRALKEWRDDVEPRLRIVEKHSLTPDEKRDVEHRIRALEARERKYAGAVAVIVVVCTLIGTFLAKKLGG